ncbi:DUF2971 domain-containing protein [Enterobacter quasiroggenkampii]
MSKPKILYKYMGGGTLEKILRNNSLKISRPSEFNDPFDSSFPGYSNKTKITGELERMFSYYLKNTGVSPGDLKAHLRSTEQNKNFNEVMFQAIEELRVGWDKYIDYYRILCLSKNKNNILMWSHYAQYHKGAVIGFDFNEEDFYSEIARVTYDSKNNLIDNLVRQGISLMANYIQNHPSDPETALNQLDALMKKDDFLNQVVWFAIKNLNPSFFIKKYIWNYEEEYRIVRFSEEVSDNLLTFSSNAVKEIIFGINMCNSEKESVIKLISTRKYPTKIFQAKKLNSDLSFEDITHQVMA